MLVLENYLAAYTIPHIITNSNITFKGNLSLSISTLSFIHHTFIDHVPYPETVKSTGRLTIHLLNYLSDTLRQAQC